MKRFLLWLLCLSFMNILSATNVNEINSSQCDQEEMLVLESEIDSLIEEEVLSSENEISDSDYPFNQSKQAIFEPTFDKSDDRALKVNHKNIEVEEKTSEVPPLPIELDLINAEEGKSIPSPKEAIDAIQKETSKSIQTIEINLREVFAGSPIIYSLLFFLSTISLSIWLYCMLTIRSVDFLPTKLVKELRTKISENQFDDALNLCAKQKHFFYKMLASGISSRNHGPNVIIDTMKAEGKRNTVSFWQRVNLLNEIAIIAPMLGLLGTVLGMFYAFYDLNRSIESVSLLFDGLGISVGTTFAGLVVAIISMILYSIAKYRLVRILVSVENEAQSFAALINTRSGNS